MNAHNGRSITGKKFAIGQIFVRVHDTISLFAEGFLFAERALCAGGSLFRWGRFI
jgi:hypothetical protein